MLGASLGVGAFLLAGREVIKLARQTE